MSEGGASGARLAATVLLFRAAGPGDPEVLLLRRHARSGFAASAWVFPGGAVDAADGRLDPARWSGADPGALAPVLGHDPATALALCVAAVRETFEEAGLLLARGPGGAPPDLRDPAVAGLRAELAAPGADLGAALAAYDLVLDLAALTPWRRWVTPVEEPRRYDTVFFLARAPDGQVADHDRVETVSARWTTAAAALEAHGRGDLPMIYPTVRTLEEVAGASLPALRDRARAGWPLRPLLPRAVVDAGGRVVGIVPDSERVP